MMVTGIGRVFVVCVGLSVALLPGTALSAGGRDTLADAFANPPPGARPHTWWHWMNGNITKEGITADLEAMARVGVGGAQIFNAGCGIPPGPVEFNTAEWLQMVKHAAGEARRLGVELCIHNCAGWSSSGGPWNTPEHGMKFVVTSEVQAQGPTQFEGTIPQPPSKLDWYRDIALLAFKNPAAELHSMGEAAPTITLSSKAQNPDFLIDGKDSTVVQLHKPNPRRPASIDITFAQPYTARTLRMKISGGMRGCHGKVEVSDDGKEYREVATINIARDTKRYACSFEPVSVRYYRIVFTSADRKMKRLSFAELDLSTRLGVSNLAGKTFRIRGGNMSADSGGADPDGVVSRTGIQDLTRLMKPDGKLIWSVPEGHWTILRVGYTPNGRKNHPAPEGGSGLECDKLSKAAAQAHWDGMMGRILEELGPLAGHPESGLNNVLIDSYEVGTQNWTQGFKEEFRKRRGYDLTPFLPVFADRVVDSLDITERFLWDFRRTIADLFAENYSGAFAEMAHKAGLQYSVEAYGNGPHDDLQYGSYGDIPMGEFWAGGSVSPGNAKLAASMAHVNGRKYVGAEAFTASPEAGKWLKDPYSIKAQGDAVYCGGINRMIYHRYAHQPWLDRLPGMTMGQWGTHFERTLTWWEQGKDWLKYQARCQYLLQEGQFVADVCFYCGEGAPNGLHKETLPTGYDYDGCDTQALLSMTVKDGRIVLPSGMSYRLLVLPRGKTMTPPVLRAIGKLVSAGATVIGPKPEKSPSLTDYPACDSEVAELADALWQKGIVDCRPADALKKLDLPPDFVCEETPNPLAYIHRVIDGAEVYFVASRAELPVEFTCTFRIKGKVPELWHPDSGQTELAPVWKEEERGASVRLRFGPSGSVFVVFRKSVPVPHAVAVACQVQEAKMAEPVSDLKILKAEYGVFPEEVAPDCVDVTDIVKRMIGDGERVIRATNALKGDPAQNVKKELQIEYLAGGEKKIRKVPEHQTITVPEGAQVIKAVYGLIEEAPPPPVSVSVDLTEKLSSLVDKGKLRVRADNALAGKDPAHLTVKELVVDYVYRGVRKQVRVHENQMLVLPEETGRTMPVPDYELTVISDKKLELHAWKPGTFEIEMADGRTVRKEIADVPKPFELTGPWTVAFPPNWGAPTEVSFPILISWTEYSDDGVKYFSGTGTYTKTFQWSGASETGARYILDLGDMRNIAEIELNGRNLGIIWKPPFRVDVTDALKSGTNALRIQVTNMWPNRLIGDERLHDPDCEWKGLALKEWPQWLLDGKPSPTGRLTFTTWHHWTKDDAPLVSGLLGPVTIRTIEIKGI